MPETKHFQCRHIFTDGRRCGSKSLHAEPLCYYHHTTHGRAARRAQQQAGAFRDTLSTFDLPLPEDRSAIQLAIGEIMLRIASGNLDSKRAGLLLYALQIASLNLPREPRTQPETAVETVEEIIDHPGLGPLAPEHELIPAAPEKSLMQTLIEYWRRGDDPKPTTLATLQACTPLRSFEKAGLQSRRKSSANIAALAAEGMPADFNRPVLADSCQLRSLQLANHAFRIPEDGGECGSINPDSAVNDCRCMVYRPEPEESAVRRFSLRLPQQPQKISQHRQIRQQQRQPNQIRPLGQLIELPGKKRDRQSDRQVLRPGLLQHQSDAFHQRQSRVSKREDSRKTKIVRVD
jgi:hypothetical protein